MLTKGFKDNLSSWFEIAARHEGDLRITTWVPVRDDLRGADGALRLAALTFAVDSAVGMSAGFSALPNWVVTTDIDLRIFADARVGPVRTEAHTLRAGRSQVLAEARLYDEGQGDLLVGHATANHGALSPENGAPLELFPVGEILRQSSSHAGVRPQMSDTFGARVVEPGIVELDMVDNARNPWGILHGCLHTLLAEDAARSLVDGRITGVSIRFMAPVRVGPARAHATLLASSGGSAGSGGPGGSVTVRVEVRDPGAHDRLGSLALITVHPEANVR